MPLAYVSKKNEDRQFIVVVLCANEHVESAQAAAQKQPNVICLCVRVDSVSVVTDCVADFSISDVAPQSRCSEAVGLVHSTGSAKAAKVLPVYTSLYV